MRKKRIFKLLLVLVAAVSFASAFEFEVGDEFIGNGSKNGIIILTVIDKKGEIATLKGDFKGHEILAVFIKNNDGFDLTLFQDKILGSTMFFRERSAGVLAEYSTIQKRFYRKGYSFTKISKTP